MKKANKRTGETSREESSLLGSFFYVSDQSPKPRRRYVGNTRISANKSEADVTSLDKARRLSGINGHTHGRDIDELGERLRKLSTNPNRKDGKISANSAPRPSPRDKRTARDCLVDEFRILYLLTRMEQQMSNVARHLTNMHKNNTPTAHINAMTSILNGLMKMNEYLLSVRDDDDVARGVFEKPEELEEFLRAIEGVCGAVERITSGGTESTPGLKDMKDMMQCALVRKTNAKDIKRSVGVEDIRVITKIDEQMDTSFGDVTFVNPTEGLGETTGNNRHIVLLDVRKDIDTHGKRDTPKTPAVSRSEIQQRPDPSQGRTVKGTKSWFTGSKNARYQPDPFIEEFDKLLEQCILKY